MQPEKLKEIKDEIQKILDKHLEPENRFSIEDLDEDSTFLLVDLLLEKDDLEREKIWAKIEEQISTHKMNLELNYEGIIEIKDKLSYLKSNFNDLDSLKNLVNCDQELDSQLNEI